VERDGKMRLQGSVAIVTGASRGIGRAIALAFATEGASVALNYLSSEDKALETVAEIAASGGRAVAVKVDVADPAQVGQMVSRVMSEWGRIDVLVNNAGVIEPFDFENPDYAGWQRMVDVNIKGMLTCSHAVARPMRDQGGGRIINVVVKEARGSLDYIMTKASDEVLTRGLARELAPSILVNAIAPGYIDTGWISQLDEEARESIKAGILLKRWGEPEDVARVAVFLASDDSAYLTGTTILVDGGAALV
jgi:3-oxoacyl-[acyl-carrier protein] reductase